MVLGLASAIGGYAGPNRFTHCLTKRLFLAFSRISPHATRQVCPVSCPLSLQKWAFPAARLCPPFLLPHLPLQHLLPSSNGRTSRFRPSRHLAPLSALCQPPGPPPILHPLPFLAALLASSFTCLPAPPPPILLLVLSCLFIVRSVLCFWCFAFCLLISVVYCLSSGCCTCFLLLPLPCV